MASVLAASEIVEMALEKVGAYPTSDRTPDPEYVRRSLRWLDAILAELAGTSHLLNRIEQAVTISLTSGAEVYDLIPGSPDDDEANPDLTQVPPAGIVRIKNARLLVNDIDRGEIEFVGRETFERIRADGTTGQPCHGVFIPDGNLRHKMGLSPVPTFSAGTMKVRMLVQHHFDHFRDGRPDDAIKIGSEWELYLINALAVSIGDGPVTRRPDSDIARFAQIAAASRNRLEAFRAGEVLTGPQVVEAWI